MHEEQPDEIKKRVDESWKDSVRKEKADNLKGGAEMPEEVTFGLFIAGLMMEALIALGDAEHPVTHKKELNGMHAKFIIDTLEMLREKTKNNLTKDEDDAMNAILYDLRMRFVTKIKDKAAGGA